MNLVSYEKQRLDQWLVYARFAKSRNVAKEIILKGKMRINGEPTNNISIKIKVGDIIVFFKQNNLYMIEIIGLSHQRIAAKFVHHLYKDILVDE
ncbi:MAG: S4 domain-containing protein [Alphaproteobacteria bacterium]